MKESFNYIEDYLSLKIPEDLKTFLRNWEFSNVLLLKGTDNKTWRLKNSSELITDWMGEPFYLSAQNVLRKNGISLKDKKIWTIAEDDSDLMFINSTYEVFIFWHATKEIQQIYTNYKEIFSGEVLNLNSKLDSRGLDSRFIGEWHPTSKIARPIKFYPDGRFKRVGIVASLFAEDDWGVKNGELILKNKGDDDFVYTITDITDASLKLVGPLPLKNKIIYIKKETNTFI